MKARMTLSIALALVGLGCALETSGPGGSQLPGDDDAPIVTDANRYELRLTGIGWESAIGFAFQNVTDGTISLVNCHGAYALMLEKLVGDEWTMAWGPVLPECLGPTIEIAPGEVFTDTIHLTAGSRGSNLFPQFSVHPISGVYRLVVTSAYHDYVARLPWGDPVPFEARVSNRFEIVAR